MAENQNPSQEPLQLDTEAPTEGQSAGELDTEALLKELEKLDITTPERVQNLAQAGRLYHQQSQVVGSQRDELEQLRREIQQLSQGPQRRGRRDDLYDDDDTQQYGQPVDLRGEIKSVLRDFYQDEVIRPQQQAAQAYWRGIQYVESHKDYPLVEDRWKKHFGKPDTQMRLQTGQSSIEQEYSNLVMDTYRDIALKSREAIKRVSQAQSPEAAPTPHMESSSTETPAHQRSQSSYAENLTKATDNWAGTDDDIDRLLDVVLPDDDKLLHYGVEAAPIPQSKVGKRKERR
jgi:hypothetical protein